jgi:hypothetical protein
MINALASCRMGAQPVSMTWTILDLLTLMRSLPPGLPLQNRRTFAHGVARALDDYLAALGGGWAPGKSGSRAAAYKKDGAVARDAIIAMEAGHAPPPISALSPAMQQRVRHLPVSRQDKAMLGASLAVAGARRVVESKGRGKTRVRWDIRLLGEVGPGRVPDDEADVLLWRIGYAWSHATGKAPTSRHDGDTTDVLSPIARAFAAVKTLRPAALGMTPQAAAQRLGEIRRLAA